MKQLKISKALTMETKEAINILQNHKYEIVSEEEQNQIIELLQRGEKFEEKFLEIFNENKKIWQMWDECKKDITRASVENWKVSAERFALEMRKLEQKYFPKEADNET